MEFSSEKKITVVSKIRKQLINRFKSNRRFLFFKKKNQDQLDKNLVYTLSSEGNIPNKGQVFHLGRVLKTWEKRLILICLLLIFSSLIYLGYYYYNKYWQPFPKSGGIYTEGLIGAPRFINPLYAIDRDVDSDLVKLIYSGLFSYDSNGRLTKDLVSNWEISENKLEYFFDLKPGVKWHNGQELTAADVIFTFYLMKNPDFHSPWRRRLAGIEAEKINELSVKFILQEPYAPFFELLTFGILPQFAWESATPDSIVLSELNLKPIGSGPYKFKSLTKNKVGEIREYRLAVNSNYHGRQPYIAELVFKFYFDFFHLLQALNDKQIDGAAYLPPSMAKDVLAKNSFWFHELSLPQVKAIFFNQGKNKDLVDKNIRQALAISLDRDRLIKEVLNGFAVRSDSPLPISNFAYNSQLTPLPYSPDKAKELLDDSGFEKIYLDSLGDDEERDGQLREAIMNSAEANDLSLSGPWRLIKDGSDWRVLKIKLKIPETDENLVMADLIKEMWELIGVKTVIVPLPLNQIQEEIVKNKDFEVLLYQQIVGSDPYVSAFWYSSQAIAGLNLINYRNSEIDTLLSDARQLIGDQEKRIEKYYLFQELLIADLPAIFLFSPVYPYIQDRNLKGFATDNIINPRDRFSSINDWYVETKKRFIR